MSESILQLLYFDRIVVSERIDVDKTSESKECNIFHHCYFLNKGFKFQPYVCKNEAINLMQNIDLTEKRKI